MKRSLIFLLGLFLIIALTTPAFAAGGSADPIFQKLAEKAGVVGRGLRDTGFIIAGLGLIVFTFAAIFNKLSWKHLAYIMFSTFLLSVMIGAISYFGEKSGRAPSIPFNEAREITPPGNAQAQPVKK